MIFIFLLLQKILSEIGLSFLLDSYALRFSGVVFSLGLQIHTQLCLNSSTYMEPIHFVRFSASLYPAKSQFELSLAYFMICSDILLLKETFSLYEKTNSSELSKSSSSVELLPSSHTLNNNHTISTSGLSACKLFLDVVFSCLKIELPVFETSENSA